MVQKIVNFEAERNRRNERKVANYVPNEDERRLSNKILQYRGDIRCLCGRNYYYGIVKYAKRINSTNTVVLTAKNASGKLFEVDFPISHLVKTSQGEESHFVEKPGRIYLPLSCLVDMKDKRE